MQIEFRGVLDDCSRILTDRLQTALELSMSAHAGQTDKGGKPYYAHPLAVCRIVNHISPSDERLKDLHYLKHAPLIVYTADDLELSIAALLHDVLEDTSLTVQNLRNAGIPESCVQIIQVLTRRQEESYSDYIERVACNPRASIVKLADLAHNCDLTRLDTVTEADRVRRSKYVSAASRLQPEFFTGFSMLFPETGMPAPESVGDMQY
ncbi:hypothetical protein [Anaerolentibacter hominis]|uniref:hypothetical protein n=1 Tax=Anaerolentibacter hominis TaxID=3079009 RepID=UPI0031B87916